MTSPVSPLTRRLLLAWLPAGLGLVACDHDITIVAPTAPDPPTPPIPDRIEFRVLGVGDWRSVTIRHVNQQDGTAVVKADLPYFATFTTLRDSMFLSLEARALGEGWLQVQILINGYLLQESTSSDADPRLSVAVNYRRGQYPAPLPVPV